MKVFAPDIQMEMTERENTKAKDAFIFGVPAAISCDTVKAGEHYGLVYELLYAEELAEVIYTDKAPAMMERSYLAGVFCLFYLMVKMGFANACNCVRYSICSR